MFKFNTPQRASNFLVKMENPGRYSLILGDDNLVWVVTNREAGRLISQGYEMIPLAL